LALKAH